MDPVSQGLVGSVACQIISNKKKLLVITVISFLSALAPDLDIFIRSKDDPILFLEFHRQFTHSLIFIPIGGLLCALFFNLFIPKVLNMPFKHIYIICTLAYGTHGILDAFTSYGTQLLWPFTDERISWHLISVIDPIFTIPILLFIMTAVIKNKKLYSYFALGWLVIYIFLSYIQQHRATTLINEIISQRNHFGTRLIVKPSFANIIVWKTLYESDNYYYIDAIRLTSNSKFIPGTKTKKLNIEESFPWLDRKSKQAIDIERFRWFSDNYLSQSQKYPLQIMDVRFTSLPHTLSPLWSIELDPEIDSSSHVKYITNRGVNERGYENLWKMIIDNE